MSTSVMILLGVLGVMTATSTVYLCMESFKNKDKWGSKSWIILLAIGFITDFLDTLGIGSFAPTTALFRATKTVDDKEIPGTLNVGHTIPVVLEAFLFITMVEVEAVTLVALLAAATLGAVIGAGIVAKLPVKIIRLGMGGALLVVVVVMALQMAKIFPSGGDAIGLTGAKLIFGVVANFILGALMTIGIGLYAPCMALVYSLGMSPKVAFPIMMGSCAFLMPAASMRFIKEAAYDRKASLALTVGGAVGVLMAYYVFSSLDINMLKYLVIVVITYTSITMLRDGLKD